ncbi:MAG: hypothetical protein JXA54_08435 [Candidatus Heimdallarchaeota archaeon]|nr:hypothetical protein [Candidatus Heimdallarchaeota archaeon]
MISLSKMKVWFEEETESSVKKIRLEIKRWFDVFSSNLEELKIAAKDFEVNDTVDAESRSSQNIYEKMTEMVDEFEVPEKVTYKTAEELIKSLEKFLQRVLTLGRRFIPNLKKKYKTRVFILNRALTRLQKNYHDFEKYLADKSVLLKEVDQTSDDISIIIDKVKERENLKNEIKNENIGLTSIDKELEELNNSTASLKSQSILQELDSVNKEINNIGNKLKYELSGLDKPLRKLLARGQDGKVMIPPHLVDFANLLRDDPLKAMEGLEIGYSQLKDLMDILIDAVKDDKLKLKSSMNNKATSLGEEIIEGSLKDLHNELLDLLESKKQIEIKVQDAGLKEQIEEFQHKFDTIEKNRDRIRRRINDLEAQLESLNDEIVNFAAETQRNVRKLTKQDVKINIKE